MAINNQTLTCDSSGTELMQHFNRDRYYLVTQYNHEIGANPKVFYDN
jgi:hypothetical protein